MLISSQCVCSNHFHYSFCLPGGRTNRIKWKAKQLFVPVQLERVCVLRMTVRWRQFVIIVLCAWTWNADRPLKGCCAVPYKLIFQPVSVDSCTKLLKIPVSIATTAAPTTTEGGGDNKEHSITVQHYPSIAEKRGAAPTYYNRLCTY